MECQCCEWQLNPLLQNARMFSFRIRCSIVSGFLAAGMLSQSHPLRCREGRIKPHPPCPCLLSCSAVNLGQGQESQQKAQDESLVGGPSTGSHEFSMMYSAGILNHQEMLHLVSSKSGRKYWLNPEQMPFPWPQVCMVLQFLGPVLWRSGQNCLL